MAVWFNGEILESATVDAANAGALLGWGIFTTIGVRGGRPILLERHYARLARDATQADIELPWSESQFTAGIQDLIRTNGVQHGLARATLTKRGDGRWNAADGADLLLLTHESPSPSTEPARLWLTPCRAPSMGTLAGVKLTSYLPYLMAWQEAQRAGCHDALLTNAAGQILETARANIFWVRDGVLCTPSLDTGCLRGVGREFLMEIAGKDGWTVEEVWGLQPELLAADEVLIVSAATGPRAVSGYLPNPDGDRTYRSGFEQVAQLRRLWDEHTSTRE